MLQRFLLIGALGTALLTTPSARADDGPAQPKPAQSRITHVTVYPNNALVTREVEVPEGAGSLELVVSSLPPRTVDSSLYSEGTDGIRILTTRYRIRPILEDTREEVRKAMAQLKQLQQAAQKLQSEIGVVEKNMQLLAKLEDFTATSLKALTEKSILNGDAIIALAKYVMDTRAEKAQALIALRQQLQDNTEQIQFVQRKLHDLSAGSTKTERDAVIIVDKKERAPGKIRLNYLVDSASWRPQYKLRADVKETKPVLVEYLAAVVQQSGEDWRHVNLYLSTAQPRLSAVPPDLKLLEVAVVPRNGGLPSMPANTGAQLIPGQPAASMPLNSAFQHASPLVQGDFDKQTNDLRVQAQNEYAQGKPKAGDGTSNTLAALEQGYDLLASVDEFKKKKEKKRTISPGGGEGPSITYPLSSRLTIPTRNDEQVIEVTKLEMTPGYYYKAVPVLTQHVYRLADLTNTSKYVLLPGEATMYIGTDFVGRADLPLVAIGEQFTAGFGVDPQLQVQRQLLDKNRTTQGDNQVWKFEYRILVSSYKSEPVKLQVWDRLPHGETEAVGVNLLKAEPKISIDPLYLRENRPSNLLRWDLSVDPVMNGEKALAVNYEFKLELGRQMMISNILAR